MKNVKTLVNVLAVTQAIVAPGLMVIGAVKDNTTIKVVGAIWSALVVIDTVRTTRNALDMKEKFNNYKEYIEVEWMTSEEDILNNINFK